MSEIMDGSRHNPGNDPLETRIRTLIQDQVYSTSEGKEMFLKAKSFLVSYLKDFFSNSDSEFHDKTQDLLKNLAEATKSKIVQGENYLNEIPKKTPVFALTNHFGGYKLIAVDQEEVNAHIPGMDKLYTPPMFYASLWPVAERLGDNLYDAHLELPGDLKKLEEKEGLIIIPTDKGGQFELVVQRTKDHLQAHSNSLTVIFPEGGTSGKRNNGGPYDLERFRTGPFRIAAQLGVTILPVGQFFNPNSGFEVAVFKPFMPRAGESDKYFENLASNTQIEMQKWFDTKKSS